MSTVSPISPRILILESDRKTRAALRRYAVKGFEGASVQSTTATLSDAVGDADRLKAFDVVLVGCDFSADGSTANPVFAALRAIAADPDNPPIVLLTHGGSEYTAVQAIKAGAFDCIPRHLLGREQLLAAVQKALPSGRPLRSGPSVAGAARLFGYDLRRRLSRHDNVSVHVAYSAEKAEEVVLKVLHRGRGSLLRDGNFGRFIEEFMLLYDIDDPAVAEIYDFRIAGEYSYIAMEYFRSGHLGEKLVRPVDVEEALRTASRIAGALSIVHAAGVVHRDLKPGNVMVRDDGTLALIDFGLAQSASLGTTAGAPKVIAGTPYYMSPEQARGEPTDERTDLYALGVILFQMLAGRKPYTGDSAERILEQHSSAPIPALPPPLGHLQPLIDRLLAKNANQRFASAREAAEAIDAVRAPRSRPHYALAATSA